jgi:putative cell wall-binding protein
MAGAATRKTSAKRSSAKSHARRKSKITRGRRRWSKRVTETSNAMDLRGGVFKLRSAKQIAASLKRSAERSHRRKSNPYRSALSMLTFYINRAGKNLPASRKKVLNQAKDELKHQFHKD